MFPVARPKPGDTEEDLLRQQEEFLRSKAPPAAKVVKKPDKRRAEPTTTEAEETAVPETKKDVVDMGGLPGSFGHTTTAPPVKKSKFKEHRDRRKFSDPEFDVEEQLEKGDSHITKVLTEIVERDIKNVPVYYPDSHTLRGFPTAPHRGDTEVETGDKKKKSIFAQQFARGSAQDFGLKSKPPRHESMFKEERKRVSQQAAARPTTSVIVTGEGLKEGGSKEDAEKIHMENMNTLSSMSEAEIIQEQQKLLESLDPSLVSFFKSKKPSQPAMTQVTETTEMEVDQAQKALPKANQNISKKTAVDDKALPIQPTKKWPHMDRVEPEKLEWMKDLPPPPKADNLTTGKPARFDFQGDIVAVDADVSTREGLHHHGSEPERAGYTFEELFQLARSANIQQRVVAITTIGRILLKVRAGSLTDYVQVAVVPALLDGGLVHILRWALDDSTDNTMTAAVYGLHSLLVSQQDEDGADRTFCWHQGTTLPSLQPPPTPPPSDDDENEQPSDADVLKEDVIKGLLRMQILQRMRYILEVWKPAATVVIQILQILTRIARHSTQSAYEITQCPRLLETIFKEFLPTTWTPVDGDAPLANVHGYPVPEALKLVRVICAAGTNMAANIVSKSWLMTCVSRYIVEDPSDLQLPPSVASHLQVESLRTWQVLTSYGLASHSFSGLYPVLMKSLQGLPSLYHLSNPALLRWGEATLGLLESVVALAATTHKLTADQHIKANADSSENVAPAAPAVNWSHVMGLFQPVEVCLQNTLKEFTEVYTTKKHDLTFASCCLNFVSTYISKMDSQPGYNAVEWLDHLEKLASSCLLPCLTSAAFTRVLGAARDHSMLLYPGPVSRREVPPALPELGALVSDSGAPCPLLKDSSPVHFTLAMTRLLAAIGRLHKDLASKLYPHLLQNEELVFYVRRSCQVKHTPAASNSFSRFENLQQYYLLNMARIQPGVCDTQLLHQMSLFLIARIHQGDDHLAHDLLCNIIFNPDFVGDLVSVELSALSELEQLQLADHQVAAIGSATQRTVQASREQLASDITQHLASMRGSYLSSSAGLVTNLHRSRWRMLSVPHQTESLLLGPVGQLVAPVDWPFLPLVDIYNRTSPGGDMSEMALSPQLVALVTDSLRLIYTLERWRPGVLESIKFVTKLTRLMCTFLAGSDLFLDSGVHMFLEAIYKLYCRPIYLERMDFTKRVPGLVSFYDFYIQLLMHYEAVSFGDSLFGCFLLLPLQQRHDVQMRKALWTEHASILRVLSIPLKEIPIPLENFLQPDETNIELVRLYYQALFSGSVNPRWSPFLYLVAVHHVNRFMYTQEPANHKLRVTMLQRLTDCKHQNVVKDVIYYKKVNHEVDSGIEHYQELPVSRSKHLEEARRAQES